MASTTKEVARIFKEMAAIYQYKDDHFRSVAYENAARTLGSLQEDIEEYSQSQLEDLKDVGSGTAKKIKEYIDTGKMKRYEKLKKEVPSDFIELMKVKGFGPKSLKKFEDELGLTTKEEIVGALNDGRIENLKGFGKKKVEKMLKGLEMYESVEERILLGEALEISEHFVSALQKQSEIEKIEVAGSLRRRKETIGDVDILVAADEKHWSAIIDDFVNLDRVEEILAQGDTKVSVITGEKSRQVDLLTVQPDQWGAALQYFTGSQQHNVAVRGIAREQGLTVSEYGVFQMEDDKKISGQTEEDVYESIGLQWVPPEMRQDNGEIELAKQGKIPDLVSVNDMKGDLQMHSVWSDGARTLEEVARFVRDNFDYEYIAMTDHSKAVRVANGMNAGQFWQQIEAIEKVNGKLGESFLKSGTEVDVNLDGSMDLPDDLLEELDWVVASIHTNMDRDNTDRLIMACEHPQVDVIGHPTGRMIGKRGAYPLDIEAVIEAAKQTGTALEINGQPKRMDLNDQLARQAREREVPLVISTDSHSFDNFYYMKIGVSIARRAWCTADDILNTKSWSDIEKFKAEKQERLRQSSTTSG